MKISPRLYARLLGVSLPASSVKTLFRLSHCVSVLLFALAIICSSAMLAHAASGDLDTTFGWGGKTSADFINDDCINDMTLQPDGKILVAGSISNYFGLARYQNDGALDTTFGNGGVVTTPLPGIPGYYVGGAFAIALQQDGKIVLAGISISESDIDFAVARYNNDGSLDTSFGDAGWVITDFFGEYDLANDIAIQADGKIVVAGAAHESKHESYGARSYIALIRYNTDGSLDATFGDGGKSITKSYPFYAGADAVAIQPDGKIVVAGNGQTLTFTKFLVARFNTDGSLERTFGDGGVTLTGFMGGADYATDLALQPDGKIVLAGFANTRSGSTSDFAVARYNSNGHLDRDFGTNGKVITDLFGGFDTGNAMALLPDGRIIVIGNAQNSETNSDFATAVYTTDGKLDMTFGQSGRMTTDFYGFPDNPLAIALQPDGKFIVGGCTFTGHSIDFALARYTW